LALLIATAPIVASLSIFRSEPATVAIARVGALASVAIVPVMTDSRGDVLYRRQRSGG